MKSKTVFEQSTLSGFKMGSSAALEIFNNYNIIITNNNDNIRKS